MLVTVAAYHNNHSLCFILVKCCIASVFKAAHLQHDVHASGQSSQPTDYLGS
jgi:hypothetical protein